MDARTNYLDVLSATIQLKHSCRAVHWESIPVTDPADGETIWAATVEVFELRGHPHARRCYAWVAVHNDGEHQFVTLLQKGLVVSPETAVKEGLVAQRVAIRPTGLKNCGGGVNAAQNERFLC